MNRETPDRTHPFAGSGGEGQAEYIRRLETRLQEIWSLVARRRFAGLLTDPESIAAGLKCFATEKLGFTQVTVHLAGDPIPEPSGRIETALRDGHWVIDPPHAAIPMMCGEAPMGVILVDDGPEAKVCEDWPLSILDAAARESASDLMLLRALRDRTIAHARIEAMSRLEEAILDSTRLEEVLSRGVKVAVETLGAAWGVVWMLDRGTENLRIAATFGTATASNETAAEDRLSLLAAHAKVAIRGRGLLRRTLGEKGQATQFPAAAVPVIAFGETLGAIALAGRPGDPDGTKQKGFLAEDEPFLRLFAAHAALAIQNASVLSRHHEAEERVKEAERQLVQSAKLAALGEMSAKLAHEIRNPLSAVGGFARRITKALPKDDPSHSYAEIIARETARLEAILSEHLDFARAQPPRMTTVDLNATVRESIELIRPECESGGVKVLEAYESRIPPMLLDAGRVKQVLLNILKNARQSTCQGQRIRVRTRASDGWAQIEIANDGEKLPGEILEQLFIPFATAKSGGCGLGLAVADQIVKEHGGEIRVRSDPEWSVIFTVSLPVRSNQERRRRPDRRVRDRRRAA